MTRSLSLPRAQERPQEDDPDSLSNSPMLIWITAYALLVTVVCVLLLVS